MHKDSVLSQSSLRLGSVMEGLAVSRSGSDTPLASAIDDRVSPILTVCVLGQVPFPENPAQGHG